MECQPNSGSTACPCVGSYHGFRVANVDNITGHLNVRVPATACDATPCDYGSMYGLGMCSSHDAGTPPYCDVPGSPAWCAFPWCYVNASNCDLASAPSSYIQTHDDGSPTQLHYSYKTCDAADSFTEWYTQRTGTIHLCSVFSEHAAQLDETIREGDAAAARPCGNTHTHLQVEAVVEAIRRLNGGRGFALQSGLITRYYTFNYTYRTYPFGEWVPTGRELSREMFGSGSCDVVVGMANGCPDLEIIDQALIANETKRIYVTGRGPQRTLTAAGTYQPYLFSTHLRSDEYALPALRQYVSKGSTSMAILGEASSNHFFADLGRATLSEAKALSGMDVRFNASLPPRQIDGTVDVRRLDEQLVAMQATRSDIIFLVMREPEFRHTLQRLREWRPRRPRRPNAASAVERSSHLYKGIWWTGVPWGNEDCLGLAEQCEFMVGASQMSATEVCVRALGFPCHRHLSDLKPYAQMHTRLGCTAWRQATTSCVLPGRHRHSRGTRMSSWTASLLQRFAPSALAKSRALSTFPMARSSLP